MERATVTGKGQVTLPLRIRERLNIQTGDKLLFNIEDGVLKVSVLHGQGISELFAALPGVEAYAGAEAEEEAMQSGFLVNQP